MKTVSKKLLSVLLVAFLLISAIPFQAFADPVAHDASHALEVKHDGTYHWSECTVAECTEAGTKFGLAEHHYVEGLKKLEPTCTDKGHTETYDCDFPGCGYGYGGFELPATGHTLTDVSAVPATCEAAGTAAGKKCESCDFTEGLSEIPALGHDMVVTKAAVPATCTATGLTAESECTRCPYHTGGDVIEMLPHTYVDGKCACGAKEPASEHPDSHVHQLKCIHIEGTNTHKYICTVTDCTYEEAPEACTEFGYENETHRCKECGDMSIKDHALVEIEAEVPAKCTEDGTTAKSKCTLCGKTFGGEAIPHPITGHKDADGDGKCDVCPETISGAKVKVSFVVGEGHEFAGMAADVKSITKEWTIGSSAYEFPGVVESKYATFLGWYTAAVGGDEFVTTKPYDGTITTLYAHWQETTYPITLYRILNKDASTAKKLTTLNLTPDCLLSEAVKDAGYLNYVEPGYKVVLGGGAEFPIMKFVSGTFVPLGSSDYASGGYNVYLNMVPCTYNLILNAAGGTVTPAKITGIAYKSTVTLPTPKKDGAVFMGWKDVNNEVYTDKMVYTFQEDTTLTAVWNDELTVFLKVYLNGDTTSAPRIYPLSQLVKDSKVFRSDVESIIMGDYVASGGVMTIYGLYSDKTWNNGSISADGNPFVEVSKEKGINYIYVMLTNAALKTTVVTGPANGAFWVSTGNGTGYWVTPNFSTTPYIYTNGLNGAYWVSTGNGTGYWVYPGGIILNGAVNPKTGDNAMIEVAAAVMILAAAALVVSMSLRKKKIQ